jgi:putative flippase GtrA
MIGGLLNSLRPARFIRTQAYRYLVCGVTAVAVRLAGFYFFSLWWPSYEGAPGLDDVGRAWNNLWANVLAFLLSNLTAYVLSARWVFVSGRHTRSVEFLIFTAVSLIGLGLGALVGPLLIARMGISHHLAVFNALFASLIVNYVGRKFVVFQK